MKHFLKKAQMSETDLQNIRNLSKVLLPELPSIIAGFYEWMQREESVHMWQFFRDNQHMEHIQQMQHGFWKLFLEARIDDAYLENRRRVGMAHARIGLNLDVYYSSVIVFNELFNKAFKKLEINDVDAIVSFYKLVNADVALVVETYSNMVQEQMRAQNQALQEMSTPAALLWKGILFLPLVGILDSKRTHNVMTSILSKIDETKTRVFILDISGIAVVDTAVANHLIKITKATRLMGCDSIVSGVSPSVAQTIVELGIQSDEIKTTGTLRDALRMAFDMVGKKVK